MSFLRENGQEIIERPELLEPTLSDIVPIRDFSDVTDGPFGTDKYLRLLTLKHLIYPYKAAVVDLGDQSNIEIDLQNSWYTVYKVNLVGNGVLSVIPDADNFAEARLILATNGYSLSIPAPYVHRDVGYIANSDVLITLFCSDGQIYVEYDVVDLVSSVPAAGKIPLASAGGKIADAWINGYSSVAVEIDNRTVADQQLLGAIAYATDIVGQVAHTLSGAFVALSRQANSPGRAGQASYDQDNLYLCIAPNTWKKVPLSSI